MTPVMNPIPLHVALLGHVEACARDKAMREGADFDECDDNELCDLIAAGFRGPVKEWIEDDSGPRCTAFVPAGNTVPEVDTLTGDLFA